MNSIFSAWFHSLKHYLQMSLFLSSPARLAASPVNIIITLIAYIVIGKIMLGDERSLISVIMQIGIEVAILFCISFFILKLIKKPERLLQTLSALIGVSLIISIISLLIMFTLSDFDSASEVSPEVLQINLALLLWNLAVISLIFKRAFEIRTGVAGFIALNYFLVYEFLLLNLF